MTIDLLSAYVAMDRRLAVVEGIDLPVDASGAVLLADISGFTPLTEALVAGLGPRRGAEELTKMLNAVYSGLVSKVHHFGGSVLCFIGDALVSFFPDDDGTRGLACGLQMQRAMKQFQAIAAPQGGRVTLGMKAAVAAGPVHRFLIGDPDIRRMDVLAGATVDRLTDAEHVAERGEVIASPDVARKVGANLMVAAWRGRYAVVEGLRANVRPNPWPEGAVESLAAERLRPYVHRPVFERVYGGQGEFLAELRPVSVLFLRFAGIDYDDDPGAGEKLDVFTRWVQSVADRFGGYVLLLTTADKGSHLYVVFGALEAHEDDRQRAVAAAVELSNVPAAMGFIEGTQIGVSYGRARVGAYGSDTRRTYGALGDAVNLAARLMQVAPAGEIRCSEAVYEAAKERWTFDALPAVTLKGIEEPRPVFRPLGAQRVGAGATSGALIGRKQELDEIVRAMDDVDTGKRRVLLIDGEAGIGKSRLVEEITRLGGERGFACLVGEADSIEQHTPYRIWRDLLWDLLDLDEGAPASALQERAVAKVVEAGEAPELAPLLNDIVDLGLPESATTAGYDPEVRRDSLSALIGALLRRMAIDHPVTLVVEDAHWLDSLSWDLVVSAARSLANRPALIVLTQRPHGELVPAGEAALEAMSGAQRLALGALPPEETAALAAARLGLSAAGLPEAVVDLLAERAEGNPFFAVELIGALRDQELVRIDEGVCTVIGDPEALRERIPDTMEGVVLSRLDRLPTDEQLTIKVASVIGRSFLVRALRDVHPGQSETNVVRDHLEDTTRRRLTLLEAEDPEPAFAFQHEVTQHVTYDTLLFEQRRELHRSVAGWYEEAYAGQLDPFVPLLVVHWNRAGHGERECEYARLAGAQAAARHANAEAEIYFSRALELIEELDRRADSPRRVETLQQRVRVRGLLGQVDGERDDLEALLPIVEASGDASEQGEVLLLWSDFHRRCGQFEDARAFADQAETAMSEAGDDVGRARAMSLTGDALEGEGQFQEARDAVERALDRFRVAGALDGQARCLKSLGVITARLGAFDEAMRFFENARERFRTLGDRKGEADILGNLGALSYYFGDYETCIEYTSQAQPLFHEMGNRIGSAKCLTNLGNSYNALGAFDEGLTHHEGALELYEQLEDASGSADSHCNIAIARAALAIGGLPELTLRLHTKAAELEAAVEAAKSAMALYADIGSQRGEVITHFNLGNVFLALGDSPNAEAELTRALEMGRELGLERIVLRSLAALARRQLLTGNHPAAAVLAGEAVQQLGSQLTPEAAEVHLTQYRVLAARGQDVEATRHLEIAHAVAVEQAAAIKDASLREGFLSTCSELVTEWKRRRATPPV